MPGSAPFRLNCSGVLLALISAGFAGEAAAAAGRVDFATSGVTVAGRDGQARPLAKGTELDTGDTIRTNNEGRAQIRFSDGSYVSLQPNTDFAISEYKFEGRDDDRGFFGLVKGAMRTVTGAVGRVNRNAYRITTPTATVGIRGTGGVIQVLNDGSTLVIGTSGIWSLTNPAGSIDVPAGVSGLAPSEPNTPPKETNTQPQTKPPEVEIQPVYTQGDQVNPDGTANLGTPPIKPLVSGSGYQLVAAFQSNWTEGTTVISQSDTTAVFNETGQLTSATGSSWQPTHVSGSQLDFGTDGILAWGRWVGQVTVNTSATPDTHDDNQGLHYVIGMPTPVMPTTGSASYSLFSINGALSATRPTYTDGSFAPGTLLPSSGLTIIFGATHTIGAKLDMQMGDNRTFSMNGTTTSGSSSFSMGATVTGTGGACSSSCNGFIQGFFAGASAERAGVGYHIQEFGGGVNKQVVGAAAFKKD